MGQKCQVPLHLIGKLTFFSLLLLSSSSPSSTSSSSSSSSSQQKLYLHVAHCSEHIASGKFNVVYFFIKAPVPCCCLYCLSADTYNSSGYSLCLVVARIVPLLTAATYDLNGYLLCRVFACIATLRILLMLVAIKTFKTIKVTIHYSSKKESRNRELCRSP